MILIFDITVIFAVLGVLGLLMIYGINNGIAAVCTYLLGHFTTVAIVCTALTFLIILAVCYSLVFDYTESKVFKKGLLLSVPTTLLFAAATIINVYLGVKVVGSFADMGRLRPCFSAG